MRIAIVLVACAMSCATASAAPNPPVVPDAPDLPGAAGGPEARETATAPASTVEPVAPVAPVTPLLPMPAVAPAANPAPTDVRPLTGFAVRGESEVKPRTVGYLAHVSIGDRISTADLPRIEQALLSSELFKTVSANLEPAPGDPSPGFLLVVTAVDKHSWIAAPTAFALPGNLAFGLGYAENNFRGLDQKFLLYGQIGTRNSLFLGSFLDPAYHGTKLTWRTDLYLFRREIGEYANPAADPTSFAIDRTTTATYLGGGALIGWNFLWWLAADLRLRGAYVYFRDARDATGQSVARPEKDGWDITLQAHLTLDHRHHRYGVTWGSYAQLDLEPSIPGLDTYGYQLLMLRAYQSWRFFEEHELELRVHGNVGRHLPLHEDLTLGGVSDLRGYDVDQFRGDVRGVFRAEYSVPLFKWRFLAFRALGFYDTGYVGFHSRRDDRVFLPNQLGDGYVRSDVGGGLRIYLNNIVLPLLGLDLGYGIEGHSPEIYFEVGLTDF
ncbi:MAG TPA: BamA/TamA family outer membrane protein [Kofleriaceae bacterium]|nr:BamA/TamA family outer membrane protein [Kofleriaceae bacterium]